MPNTLAYDSKLAPIPVTFTMYLTNFSHLCLKGIEDLLEQFTQKNWRSAATIYKEFNLN